MERPIHAYTLLTHLVTDSSIKQFDSLAAFHKISRENRKKTYLAKKLLTFKVN